MANRKGVGARLESDRVDGDPLDLFDFRCPRDDCEYRSLRHPSAKDANDRARDHDAEHEEAE